MKNYFRKENGEVVNLLTHCKEIMCKYPDAKILIGTDSQNTKLKSKYCVVVVFRYGSKGAHYIYKSIKVDKIKDMFTRLFKECEMSLEVAEFISKYSSYKIEAIELDFNDFKKTKSTPLVTATKGWCESLGYKTILKSGEMIAVKAADHECRKRNEKHQ